jgi:hypothetical protein
VKSLSPENKRVSHYVPLQAGYRGNKKKMFNPYMKRAATKAVTVKMERME